LADTFQKVPSPSVVALTGLTGLAVAMGIGRFAFTPILPMMQEDAGVSISDGGWLASANYLGFLLGALSATRLRIEPTIAIRGSLIVIGLVTIWMGLEHQFATWVVLRAMAGLANAWAQIFTMAWCLEKLAAANRPIVTGVVFAGVGLSIALVGTYCVILMQFKAGSALAWIGLGIIALIATAAIWPVFRSDDRTSQGPRGPHSTDSRGWDAQSVVLVLCFGASGVGYIIPATFLPVMARQFVSDPLVFGWAWPMFGIAAAIAPLATAGLTQRIGNRRLWMLSHLVMAFGVALPLWWPSIIGIMTSALIVGSTFMINAMASIKEAKAIAGPHATGLIAATVASFAAGQILGPICVSLLAADDGRFGAPLLSASILLAVSAAALARRPA
jgi:predicted MFS family arabinose efflux permease